MSKLHRPGRNIPTETSFLRTGRGGEFGSTQFHFEPTTCSRMDQQTVPFQGTAPATSNPPGVTVIASIFLHYVELCLSLWASLGRSLVRAPAAGSGVRLGSIPGR